MGNTITFENLLIIDKSDNSFPRGVYLFVITDENDKKYCNYISPLSYITPDSPPFLLLHGEEDSLVPQDQSRLIYDALFASKIDVKLIILEGEEHAGPQFFQRPLWDIIANFSKKNF